MTNHIKYMQLAIELAKKGTGWTSPNPLVGAVIVKDGRIIGQGYHERYGQLHAERNALANCSEDPAGATIYVTLEPCCHHGKQPPCTDALIAAGIAKVYVGSADPNPLVSGKGNQILKDHGIEVIENFMREECDEINSIFFHYIKTGMPYVTMKYAMTMDGKIAAYTGLSQWITGEEARNHVQTQRHAHRGIMVGAGTVINDNPMLTCRMPEGRNPVRIVCDTNLRIPLESKLVRSACMLGDESDSSKAPLVIGTCCNDPVRLKLYEDAGCTIIKVTKKEDKVDLRDFMKKLGELKIDSILLEGGGTLNWAALEAGLVNRVQAYIAPKLFGGWNAKTPVEGEGVTAPAKAAILGLPKITMIGDDILIESEVKSKCSPA